MYLLQALDEFLTHTDTQPTIKISWFEDYVDFLLSPCCNFPEIKFHPKVFINARDVSRALFYSQQHQYQDRE